MLRKIVKVHPRLRNFKTRLCPCLLFPEKFTRWSIIDAITILTNHISHNLRINFMVKHQNSCLTLIMQRIFRMYFDVTLFGNILWKEQDNVLPTQFAVHFKTISPISKYILCPEILHFGNKINGLNYYILNLRPRLLNVVTKRLY